MLSVSSGNLLRVVFDTNVYIAAFLRPGLSEELLYRGIRGEFTIVTSKLLLKELLEKLSGQPLFKKIDTDRFFDIIYQHAIIVTPKEIITDISADPDDNKVLECALAGNASIIVSLDKHLLKLKSWHNIPVLHPKTFKWIVIPD